MNPGPSGDLSQGDLQPDALPAELPRLCFLFLSYFCVILVVYIALGAAVIIHAEMGFYLFLFYKLCIIVDIFGFFYRKMLVLNSYTEYSPS